MRADRRRASAGGGGRGGALAPGPTEEALIAAADEAALEAAIDGLAAPFQGSRCHARRQWIELSRNRRGDRRAGRNGDVAACAGPSAADRQAREADDERRQPMTRDAAARRARRRTRRRRHDRARGAAGRRPGAGRANMPGLSLCARRSGARAASQGAGGLARARPRPRRARAALGPTAPRRVWRFAPRDGAVAASLVLGSADRRGRSGLLAPSGGEATIERAAIASYVRGRLADQSFDVASSDRHTVKPWFAGKIAASTTVVDLKADGFALIGGRIDVIGETPVATLIYQRREHQIALSELPASLAARRPVGSGVARRFFADWLERSSAPLSRGFRPAARRARRLRRRLPARRRGGARRAGATIVCQLQGGSSWRAKRSHPDFARRSVPPGLRRCRSR